MPYIGCDNSSTRKNAQGWMRSAEYYYSQLMDKYINCLSQENIDRITKGQYNQIRVDDTFIKCFPEYADFNGDKLRHHHIGEDGQAVAIPLTIHSSGYGEIHNVEKKIGVTNNAKTHSNKVQEALDAGYINRGEDIWSNVKDGESDVSKFEYIQKLAKMYHYKVNDEIKIKAPDNKEYSLNINKEYYSPYILSVTFKNIKAETVMHFLESFDIYVGIGSACNEKTKVVEPVLKIMQDEKLAINTVRISISKDNTKEEVDLLISKIKEIGEK